MLSHVTTGHNTCYVAFPARQSAGVAVRSDAASPFRTEYQHQLARFGLASHLASQSPIPTDSRPEQTRSRLPARQHSNSRAREAGKRWSARPPQSESEWPAARLSQPGGMAAALKRHRFGGNIWPHAAGGPERWTRTQKARIFNKTPGAITQGLLSVPAKGRIRTEADSGNIIQRGLRLGRLGWFWPF